MSLIQIAASLLLFLEEEESYWMMCAIIEDLLPASYYSSTLIGVQVSRPTALGLILAVRNRNGLIKFSNPHYLIYINLFFLISIDYYILIQLFLIR